LRGPNQKAIRIGE